MLLNHTTSHKLREINKKLIFILRKSCLFLVIHLITKLFFKLIFFTITNDVVIK